MKFKTNAKCGGCTAAITKSLITLAPAEMWEFDLSDPDKVLTYKGEATPDFANKVLSAIEKAGFKASML